MGIVASSEGGSDYEPIPEGLHDAICYAVYDLGTQENTTWNKWQRKIVVVWELTNQRIKIERDGKELDLPRATSKQYTLSLSDKAHLRNDLEMWRGKSFTNEELKGFDVSQLVGKAAKLQIVHRQVNEKTYANIKAIIPSGGGNHNTENEQVVYEIGQPYDHLPKWVQEKVKQSREMMKPLIPENETEPDQSFDDFGEGEEIPF